jgi:hypothetical protein
VPDQRGSVFAFVRTESFVEKTFLLVLTAVLSGVIIPLVIKSTDEARAGRAAISRAQEKLFDDVSEVVLTYQTLALDVSYFGTKAVQNPEMQKRAFERYNERVVDLVAKWRVQISRAQTLASASVASKIDGMLTEVFKVQDSPIVAAWSKCGVDCAWEEQHQENERMLGRANALIAELAADLKLVKPESTGSGT